MVGTLAHGPPSLPPVPLWQALVALPTVRAAIPPLPPPAPPAPPGAKAGPLLDVSPVVAWHGIAAAFCDNNRARGKGDLLTVGHAAFAGPASSGAAAVDAAPGGAFAASAAATAAGAGGGVPVSCTRVPRVENPQKLQPSKTDVRPLLPPPQLLPQCYSFRKEQRRTNPAFSGGGRKRTRPFRLTRSRAATALLTHQRRC